MAVFDSLAIEIQATVAGVLVLLIVTLLQIIELKRARKRHAQEIQTIARGTIPAQKSRLVSVFSLSLQFIFGLAAFALFVGGMMYLIVIEKPGLAVVAGFSAFIAVMMPFIVWSFCRKAGRERTEVIQYAQQRRQQQPVQQEKIPERPAAQAAVAQVVEESVAIPADPAVRDPLPVTKSDSSPKPQARQQENKVEAKPEVYPKPNPGHVFPQDSMLRRHFMTHLAATSKLYVPTRPSDSMLSRHYDAMLASQTAASSVKKAVPPPVASAAKYSSKRVHQVKLPEDSMLRRHFLTTLQMKIESRLPLPTRPTDSMLKRHFDAMKENLVTAELNKYLEV